MKLFEVTKDGIDYSLPLEKRFNHLPRQERVQRILDILEYRGAWNFVNDEPEDEDDVQIDIDDDLIVQHSNLPTIPLKIHAAGGDFIWTNGRLKTLGGAPVMISGDFNVSNNRLESLFGGPYMASGSYKCSYNRLKDLKGAPEEVEENFDASYNHLTTLEGAPDIVGGTFSVFSNDLTSLEHAPKSVRHTFNAQKNDMTTLVGISKHVLDCEELLLEANHIRHGGIELIHIKNLMRFTLDEFDVEKIIRKYLRKPDQLFDCQAELIDAGFEEYAEV